LTTTSLPSGSLKIWPTAFNGLTGAWHPAGMFVPDPSSSGGSLSGFRACSFRSVRSYAICSTPRSGSTLLCELLKSTGVAGRPEEYFEACADTGLPPHPRDYLAGLAATDAGIRDDKRPPHAPEYSDLRGLASYREHLDRTFARGTTANGVFATKLMWRQLTHVQALACELPEYDRLPPAEVLGRLLGDPAYVWMRRRDKVRQAISLWRALQTRIWRREQRPENDRAPAPEYSFAGIDHLAIALQNDDRSWERYFETTGAAPLTIVYEDDLEPDPAGTTERVLDHIGISVPLGWRPSEPTARQADELSERWLDAYHRDAVAERAV
jgi:LPS sulfotransferase NodH